MKKIILSLLFGFIVIYPGYVLANEEAILDFYASISVNTDNSVNVVERMIYDTGPLERHGIYRDIYPYSSTGMKMEIRNVSVTDENNLPYIFTVSKSDKNFRLKIGDPNKTFTGQKTYVIKYRASRAVGQFADFDEIYWNVTGNDWNIPIYFASASVKLPLDASATQSACYYGLKRSTLQCEGKSEDGNHVFHTPISLSAGEGLTVAVGFAKGFVTPYSGWDKISNFLRINTGLLIFGTLFLIIFVSIFLYWYKKGRDPKGTGVIVPQYDVPGGLTPLEVGAIVQKRPGTKNISSEIIYLAELGYLAISEVEKKTLGIFKSKDYELLKLKDFSNLPNTFDRKLLESLFTGNSPAVLLSSLKYKFYEQAKLVADTVSDTLLSKGYYRHFGFFPARTEKGVAAREYLLGLKMYLQIAEKDRLLFHNAPEKKPEIFEKLLPYAMVLGVADIWAKEFEGIYTQPPQWYSGGGGAFSAVAFTHSTSNFSAFASSSLSSSPGGSGSGGGGSSGGGGGGGGGGSW